MIDIKNKFNEYIIKDGYGEIKLSNRKGEKYIGLVDIEDLNMLIELNKHWCLSWNRDTKTYYVATTFYLGKGNDGKYKYQPRRLHNFLLNTSDVIDHINNNTLDNRRCNLRLSEKSNNSKNRRTRNTNNSSGYRNVSKVKDKWVVQLQINGKNTLLGRFPLENLEEAGKFAEEMRQKYYGEYKGNN